MRINLDDKFFVDPRVQLLSDKLGSLELAYGSMVRVIRLAQDYYREGMIIPADIYEMTFSKELVKCKLVEKRKDGYYVRGSGAYFDWIKQKIAAGRKGGLASASKRKQKKARASKSKRVFESAQANPSKPNLKDKDKDKDNRNRAKGSMPFILMSSYKREYENKYKKEYIISNEDRDYGLMKKFLNKAGGREEAERLIANYFTIEDEWLYNNAYPLEYMIKYINKLSILGQKNDPLAKDKELFTGGKT